MTRRVKKTQKAISDARRREEELFREASGLSAATGAQFAVVAVEPDGKARAYGCPSPEDVIVRFLSVTTTSSSVPAVRENSAREEELRRHVEQKPREEEAEGRTGGSLDSRELKELERSLELLERMKSSVMKRLDELENGGKPAGSS